MPPTNPNGRAVLIADSVADKTSIRCVCGRTYRFNGVISLKEVSSLRNQISCSCFGEDMADIDKILRYCPVGPINKGEDPIIRVGDVTTAAIEIETAPYSYTHKTMLSDFVYNRSTLVLKHETVVTKIIIKAIPGQLPKVLRWVKNSDKSAIKDITYQGGAIGLGQDLTQKAWEFLRPPDRYDGCDMPCNGVDLMYCLAMPAIGKVPSGLYGTSMRFSKYGSRVVHFERCQNPDQHLLETLVNKGETIDMSAEAEGRMEQFLELIDGTKSQAIHNAVDSIECHLSWAAIHFMGFVFQGNNAEFLRALDMGLGTWGFYDHMHEDRKLSSYIGDIWELFKYLKAKLASTDINKFVSELNNPGIGAQINTGSIAARFGVILEKYRIAYSNRDALEYLNLATYDNKVPITPQLLAYLNKACEIAGVKVDINGTLPRATSRCAHPIKLRKVSKTKTRRR